jgi:hypothetical protein
MEAILKSNHAWLEASGYQREKVIGRTASELGYGYSDYRGR